MKPNIWKALFATHWACSVMDDPNDQIGRGATPKEAYENWKAKNNK